jgi:hypothetical protein
MTDELTYLKMPKNAETLTCEKCHFNTSKQSNYTKHLSTLKHNRLINTDEALKKMPRFSCLCGKKYKHSQSLYNHKKTCSSNNKIIDNNQLIIKNEKEYIINNTATEFSVLKDLVVEVMKSNSELQKQNNDLQKQVIQLCKSNNTNSNNTINSNNKTFNLQFFLNEQCKDAMNISEFINSVTLSLQDLENVGTMGYVEGISSIIIKELKNLDIYKRPMHCSDVKRETLYIKDQDKWEKEDQENKKIKNVIKSVEHKNLKMINEWTKEHSNYKGSDDKDNDKYLNIVLESAGGIGNYNEKGNKIIKKIAKELNITKEL